MDSYNRAVAAEAIVDADAWMGEFNDAFARIAGCFGRREPRLTARDYLLTVLSDVESRNGWRLAEQAGHNDPYRMQDLLSRAVWDADRMRDALRGYVVDTLGDPAGVLIIGDSGDLKSGTASVGVQRQYPGTAGRIENSQIATYLGYASGKGRALMDRRVYLPRCWTDDAARCQAAGVPDDIGLCESRRSARWVTPRRRPRMPSGPGRLRACQSFRD